MQSLKFTFQIIQFHQPIDVQVTIFKPDDLTRYRALIGSRIIMLYRQDDGCFQIYDCGDWMQNDLAKKIADKIRETEKEVGGLLLHQLQVNGLVKK